VQPTRDTTAAHYRALLEVSQSIAVHQQLDTLVAALAETLKDLVRFDAISMVLYEPEERRIRLLLLHAPFPPPIRISTTFPVEQTPAKLVLETGKPYYVPDLDSDSNFPHVQDQMRAAGVRSFVLLPMSTARTPFVGSLNFGSLEKNPYTPEDIEFMQHVARQVAVAVENALNFEKLERLNARLSQEKLYLEDEIRTHFQFEEIVGQSAALTAVLRQVETVAPSDSAVVICGETGTGKELVARAIHDLSSRRARTFVKLNCAAIPTGLLESELFGHEKGAFTGAIARRAGRFELADGGTLFLDEIGEIPLELQPKLLRVLQENEFERLGSSRTLRVNVRLVSATNRDLAAMVRERAFRDDLYYRLNVFPIQVPPLRERREDIPLLVRHFVQQCARRMGKTIETIPSATMDALTRYSWPGNVRELQNLMERAVIVSPGPVLNVPLDQLRSVAHDLPPGQTLEDAERAHIVQVLRATKWVLSGPSGAAAQLGLKRSTLQFRMKKLGIERPG
jgi:formate hydrogenlyase transcriptional activator